MEIFRILLVALVLVRSADARDLFAGAEADERGNQQAVVQKKQLRAGSPKKRSLKHQNLVGTSKQLRRNLRDPSQEERKTTFDFVVAGFPKCGTTTLLKAFQAHKETDMAATEQCAIASPAQADAKVRKLLDGTLSSLSDDPNMKRSFKCPTAIYNYKTLSRLESHSPDAKLVVGTRHPVEMMQSYYNYRVTEMKNKGLSESIPSLEEVLASDIPWKGVSMKSTRFDLFLMQMGKTAMSAQQLEDMANQNDDIAIKPTQFKVFLYDLEQIEDSDASRSIYFRRELQDFLGLSTPLPAFGHENKNHAVGDAGHDETISICDDQWSSVRAKLVAQGAKTAAWIRDNFIKSDDVVIANEEHFLQSLESWGIDPCQTTSIQ